MTDWLLSFARIPSETTGHVLWLTADRARGAIRWTARRLLVGAFVLAVGALTVLGVVQWNSSLNPQQGYPGPCEVDLTGGTEVRTRVQVEVRDSGYPRVITEQVVRIPSGTPDVERFLLHDGDPLRQSAFGCVFHVEKALTEARDAPPRLVRSKEFVEISDRVHVDVFGPGTSWAGATEIQVDDTGGWSLSVVPPQGLAASPWEVEVSAPEGWLSSPTPWESAGIEFDHVRWSGVVPEKIGGRLSVRVRPGFVTKWTLIASSPSWRPWNRGADALGALAFAAVALCFLGLRRRQFEPTSRRTARRAMWALALFTSAIEGLNIHAAVLEAHAASTRSTISWWQVDWYVNVGFAALLTLLALMWWLPRGVAAFTAIAMFGTSWAILLVAGSPEGLNDHDPALTGVLDVFLAFTSTLVLAMAVGKAAHVLLGNGAPRTAPRRLWIGGALVAAVLVVERYATAYVNLARHEWLGTRHAVNLTAVYRAHPWELAIESLWLVLGLSALALWHFIRRAWFEPIGSPARTAAVVVLAVGPLWWSVWLLGWWLPAGALVLWGVLGFAPLFEKVWPPVLHRAGTGPNFTVARLRSRARRWYRNRTRGSSPSPIDVVLAAGPTGRPRGNMTAAMRFCLVPASMAGTGMLAAGWISTPLFGLNQEDSVLLRVVGDVFWEAAKWVLGAAALGLAWQHLPGRRGVVKVLPGIALYSLLPLATFVVDVVTDGVHNWFFVAQVAAFALVGVYVALRMDKASLDSVRAHEPVGEKPRRMLSAYGLENFPANITTLLTPAIAVLAIWSAVQGGDVTYPTVNPAQPPHGGQIQTVGR
ncbi:DUF6185 family protein [Saccharothrix xinjiangensis]|uniref:DUF6185 family protein n=1 Tax=Saccharothrix xinjiangensis TaxID=204798 RepID=A0ABV9YFA7_9PSEU